MADVDSVGMPQILGPTVRRSLQQTESQRSLFRSFFNPAKSEPEAFICCSRVGGEDWP